MIHYTENLKKIYPNLGGKFDFSLECFAYGKFEADPETRRRPAMLIFGGGGYNFVSERESAPIATAFYAKGFNCYCLNYSTVRTDEGAHFPVQLLQAAAAIDYIKSKAAEHRTDENKICVIGFSAGGHLAGTISNLFNHESVKKAFPDKPENYFRPSASVLSYAVLVEDPAVAHTGSFNNVSGGDKKLAESLSLEKRVNGDTPPAFIWCTSDDSCVDCRNSLYYASALRANKIPFELHIYASGPHGISLANGSTSFGNPDLENEHIAEWVNAAAKFILKTFA